jgi:hypothetical protein
VWQPPGNDRLILTQTVTTYEEGTTVRIVEHVPGHRLSTVLTPAFGATITSLVIDGRQATACFAELGGTPPCVLVRAEHPDARLQVAPNGGLRVDSGTGSLIDILVTATTAGDASVGLGLIDPAQVVADYGVGAALLFAADPAYPAREARLEALGFEVARTFGPYRVLTRDADR